MQHPTESVLEACCNKTLDTASLAQVEKHLNGCASCRRKVSSLRAESNFLDELHLTICDASFAAAMDEIVLAKLADKKHLFALGKPPTSHPDAPSLPDYVLIEQIGRGAFGTVWRAEDILGNPCAVKILQIGDERNTGEYELNGIRQAMRLKHPNLIDIRHVGQSGQHWYYVMELVSETLEQRLQKQNRIDPEESLVILQGILEALGCCHRNGLAHRDVKPANVGFASDGALKLIDLGLVTCANRTNRTLLGTPDYMPHKPAKTPDLDDIYAVGMILYSMISGNSPKHFPSLPADTAITSPIFSKLIAASIRAGDPLPENRFQSVGEFAQQLLGETKTLNRNARSKHFQRLLHQTTVSTTINNNMQNADIQKIKETVQFLESHNLSVSDQMRRELCNLENPIYKIAFVGAFQVGKSTLINRAFLKEEFLLKEGIGLCTTAVGTEISYGESKRLSVYPWTKKTEQVQVGDQVGTALIKDGLGDARIILNPTQDDVASATTATTEEQRLALAENTASVRLEWPANSLTKYVLFDTPGIDDPNTQLLDATTYRIIPQADTAVLVVSAKMLSEIELNFLKSRVFETGLSRIMVLISLNAETTRMSLSLRRDLIATIRAQLSSIGRAHIPVQMFCYSPDVQEDILNTPEAIENAIIGFIDENAMQSRIEKANHLLQKEIRNAGLAIATSLGAADKSDEEVKRLRAELERLERQLDGDFHAIQNRLQIDMRSLQKEVQGDFVVACDTAAKDYLDGFEDCTDLGGVRDRLDKANTILKPRLESAIVDAQNRARDRFVAIVIQHGKELEKASESLLRFMQVDLSINSGWFGKLNPTLVKIGDYALTVILSPLSLPIDLLLRFLAEKMPVIKRFLPSGLVARIAAGNIRKSVEQQMKELKSNMEAKLTDSFTDALELVKDQFGQMYMQQVAPVREALLNAEKHASRMTAEERERLASIETKLRTLVAE